MSRDRGDGLALSPGEVPGRAGTVACTWVPDESVASDGAVPAEILWSVLDCPGGWTAGPMRTPRVLVWMSAEIVLPPSMGTEHVVVAESTTVDERSVSTVSAVYGPQETMIAHAVSRWLVLASEGSAS